MTPKATLRVEVRLGLRPSHDDFAAVRYRQAVEAATGEARRGGG
jgi:hypothetical protein